MELEFPPAQPVDIVLSAYRAAEAGIPLGAACPFMFHTPEGNLFRMEYYRAVKEITKKLDRKDQDAVQPASPSPL